MKRRQRFRLSYSTLDLWSQEAPARDPPAPDLSSVLQPVAPASPVARCTAEQWNKAVSALYAVLHLTHPVSMVPQRRSLTEVVAVIRRANVFLTQLPPKGAISFTPVCPLVWMPGLCDLCGDPLYRSAYDWPNRWRCHACITAMDLVLGFVVPEQWLTGRMPGQMHALGNCTEMEGS